MTTPVRTRPRPGRPASPWHTMADVAFTLTALFAGLLGIVLHASKLAPKEAPPAALQAGDVVVTARWQDGVDQDVDLWVRGPGDSEAVGYSRRADRQSSYVRDDVGSSNDPSPLNYETVFVRGRLPGRYVVNVHLYASKGNGLPVSVDVEASIISPPSTLSKATVLLDSEGKEDTAFSFVLGPEGELVPDSVSKAYIPLRVPSAGGTARW